MELLHQYLAPVATGVFLLLFGVLVRWVIRVDRSFNAQAVVNEKVVGALNVITERLNGHEELDQSRERRLEAIEARVASIPTRSYSRGRK